MLPVLLFLLPPPRVLDPVLGATYPSCLLCREGALIVNLEHIKVRAAVCVIVRGWWRERGVKEREGQSARRLK